MSTVSSKGAVLKQKAVHEFEQFFGISLYLAFVFCAVATNRMLLLNKFNDAYFYYAAALINALVIAKIILIGEYAHVGKKYEAKPLLLSAVYKALLFGAGVRLSRCRGSDKTTSARRGHRRSIPKYRAWMR
jgi:hypothetical protein